MTKSDRDKTIENYYWFSVKYANKYHNIIKERDERRSIAGEALVRAVDTYNPTKGAKLTTHIMNCIRGDMLKERQKNKRMCRDAVVLSLDAKIPLSDGEVGSMYDILPSDAINPAEWLLKKEAHAEVRDAYKALTNGQKMILRERYIQDDALSQEDVGIKHGKTKQWVSSLERRGLAKMKNYIENLHNSTPTFGDRRVIV